ncbi:unnamed protein product [Cuscuta campestris]|uniref:CRM domain-containing protein n=1 Tax=Cuscuta campestris TaxID=132261 RepID=A0A484KVF9_9ASTE|nr:unnamed protein product [Cuscuta campestris]
MHLHWKYRELVKIIVKAKSIEQVKSIALALEAESGGVLVSVHKVSKGYSIIVFRGKGYQRPSTIRPKTLLTKRKALARSVELQRREAVLKHIEVVKKRVERLKTEIEEMNSVKDDGDEELYEKLESVYPTDDEESEEEAGVEGYYSDDELVDGSRDEKSVPLGECRRDSWGFSDTDTFGLTSRLVALLVKTERAFVKSLGPSTIESKGIIMNFPSPPATTMAEVSSVSSDNNNSSKSPHLAFTTIYYIKLHIPVQLSISEPNYKKWSRLFRLLVLRFNLMGFLDGTTVASSADDIEWYQFDSLLQGWILSTVSDEVSDLVLANSPSTYALWKAIYKLFHDNKHARAMQLEHCFRTTVKGNWSINALVLQVLQGLPHDIRSQVHFLQYQNPFPTFLEVRSALFLVEQQQADVFPNAGPSTALISTSGGSGNHTAGGGQPRQSGGGSGTGAAMKDIVGADVDVDRTKANNVGDEPAVVLHPLVSTAAGLLLLVLLGDFRSLAPHLSGMS